MAHINVFGPDAIVEAAHEVWLDPSDEPGDRFQGLLLGEGETQEFALREALEETQRVGRQLEDMLRCHLQGQR